MKILQVVPYFYPGTYGGPGKIVYEPSVYLANKGHQVDIFTSDAYDAKHRMPKSKYTKNVKNLTVYYFKNISNCMSYNYNIFIAPQLFLTSLIKISTYDLVHMHDLYTLGNVWIGFLCRLFKKPYLISVHGCLEKERLKERSVFKRIFLTLFGRGLLKNAALLVATSTKEVEEYREFGIKSSKIVLVGHAVNYMEFETMHDKKFCRAFFKLDDKKFIATYLGRLHKIKGLDLLAKAAKLLDGTKISIVIAGPDDGYLSTLKKIIIKGNLANKIFLLPGQYAENKARLLKASDIMVQPSYSEGFSLALLEYASIGKPMVVTTGCHFEDLEKYKAGIIIKPKVEQIARAIIILSENREKLPLMSKNAKKLIKENYSTEIIGKKLIDIYSKLAL